jgi:RNA polymerase sigma-70 factor (ECF subfamily)
VDLDVVVRDLAPRLLRFAFALTRDRDLAEDIAQESLAALVHVWRRGRPPEVPAAFAFAVARRRAVRRLFRRRLLVPLGFVSDHADEGRNPEAQLLDRTGRLALARSLDRLSRRDRQALLMAAAGELTTREGALALAISESAFKMRVHRARLRLAVLMEGPDGTAGP